MVPNPEEEEANVERKATKSHEKNHFLVNESKRIPKRNCYGKDGNPLIGNIDEASEKRNQQTVIWHRVIGMVVIHVYFMFCLPYLLYQKWQTLLWSVVWFHVGGIGNTAGAHRLWSHKAYRATLPLRIALMLFYSAGGLISYSILYWARDHRVHHRHTDTDLDPYNAERGFFYSHIGWLMVKHHPDCLKKIKGVDVRDVLKDPVCGFEKKYQLWLILLMCFVIPIAVPAMCWRESWSLAFHVNFFRWVVGVHSVSSINSLAHMFGSKPFNKNIYAAQNLFVSIMAAGEGWHNFHHMFPWDYRASDVGFMNVSMHFIRFCKFVGLASDLKTASPHLIRGVMLKYGDGSHPDWIPDGPEVPEEALHDPQFILPDSSFTKQE